MNKTLKQARKEGREYLHKYRWESFCYISYGREFGFYHVEQRDMRHFVYRDGYEVYILYKDGSLQEVKHTEHAKRFHAERKRRHKPYKKGA